MLNAFLRFILCQIIYLRIRLSIFYWMKDDNWTFTRYYLSYIFQYMLFNLPLVFTQFKVVLYAILFANNFCNICHRHYNLSREITIPRCQKCIEYFPSEIVFLIWIQIWYKMQIKEETKGFVKPCWNCGVNYKMRSTLLLFSCTK